MMDYFNGPFIHESLLVHDVLLLFVYGKTVICCNCCIMVAGDVNMYICKSVHHVLSVHSYSITYS